MEILFAVLMTSLFLPKDICCMNESFLSKVSIKKQWESDLRPRTADFIVDLEQAFENK